MSDHPDPPAPGPEQPRSDSSPSDPAPAGDDRGPSGAEPTGAESAAEPVVDLSEADAAIANAVALLSGPALMPVLAPTPPIEVERGWSPACQAALERLQDDLDGQRLGLAISGGGSLGSFEAGALRFLYDHVRVAPVAITGNSAGALNAAKLAHGDDPDGETAIDGVERLWRSMRTNPDMWEPEPWLARILASAQWASAIRSQVSGTSNAANAIRVSLRVLGSFVRRPEETDGTFDAIRDAAAAQSLLSLAPVKELIEAELDLDRLAQSGIALRVGAVSLESGELRYVTEAGVLHDREDRPLDHPPVPLADGILASASIPIAFPPVAIGDEHYIDGGAREILPLDILVHHIGVDRAIAISAGCPDIDRKSSFAEKSLVDILRRVATEIATNETLRKELDPPGGWGDTVRLIVPEIDVHDAMTIDPALIAISFDYGWLRASDQLLGLSEAHRALSTEITRTRMALRAHAGPLPSLFGRAESADEADGPTDATTWVDGPETLTARLREQTRARLDLGAPVPPTLLAWITGDVQGAPETDGALET